MASKEKLTIELVRARLINAKREKEAARSAYLSAETRGNEESVKDANYLRDHWDGQETALKSLLDVLETPDDQ